VCQDFDTDAPEGQHASQSAFKNGDYIMFLCFAPDGHTLVSISFFTWPPPAGAGAPQVDPADLARTAEARLELPLPRPRAWPAVDTPQITGIETWLHVDNFDAASKTADAGDVSATVHATPVEVDWDMGDGGHVTCHDAGPVFVRDGSTTCGYGFIRRSTGRGDGLFHGRVSITWHLRWDSNVGRTGDLGNVTRTAGVDWTVHELQAVIN
jgi:hypothetical protein